AEVLFGCPDGELAVESFTDTEIEFARVAARRQWGWNRLTVAVQVFNDLVHQIAKAVQALVLSGCEPGQGGQLKAGGDEFLVLGRPADAVGVVRDVGDRGAHWASSFLSIAARTWRTW